MYPDIIIEFNQMVLMKSLLWCNCFVCQLNTQRQHEALPFTSCFYLALVYFFFFLLFYLALCTLPMYQRRENRQNTKSSINIKQVWDETEVVWPSSLPNNHLTQADFDALSWLTCLQTVHVCWLSHLQSFY